MISFNLVLVFLFLLSKTNGFLFNGNKFKIVDRETNKLIKHELNSDDFKTIEKINGFYGLIGPDVNIKNVNSLYHLFTEDGNIQGIFFDNGELRYVKHFVRTEKLLFEEKYCKIPNNFFLTTILTIFKRFVNIPKFIGVANTALLNVNKKIYAVFEQDQPYLLNVDFINKNIKTVKKIDIPEFDHFSAHSKYDDKTNDIHTLDYDVLTNTISYYNMDDNFKVKSKRQLKADYIPLIHDFFVLDQSILITESPIIMNIDNFIKMRIPVKFHSEMQTKIHIIEKFSNNKNTYYIDSGFYIFHYADVIETPSHIEIYASIYENLDFSKIDIHGRFRKIIINKTSGVIEIKKNMEMEEYNLDFPIKYKNMIIFRNLHQQRVNGFVICEKHEIKNKVFFDDKSICGEPALIEIDNQHYLISLAYNDNAGFLIIINLETFHKIELPLPEKPNIGFHSIFISNKD